MTGVEIPPPPELDHAPELAVLAALEAALLAARFALIATHPPLRDAECTAGEDAPDSYWIALVFLTLADQLADVLGGYRCAIARERCGSRDRDDDLPF